MTDVGFTLFDTAIGRCAVAWRGEAIAAVQLPERTEGETRARVTMRLPGAIETAPPTHVVRVCDAVTALLRGEASDFADVVLDMSGLPPFHRRVYEVVRGIPPGATASYGEVAERLGARAAARAVGRALGRNPFAIVVPCHRVVAARGRSGGFSASGGILLKRRLLAIEQRQTWPRSWPIPQLENSPSE
jgi:methylated-DNA-[protein]-cysteine S-methyltransferase